MTQIAKILGFFLLVAGSTGHAMNDPKLGEQLLNAAGDGNYERVVTLLDCGADVNYANWSGWTALIGGVQSQNKRLIQLLLDRGADINHVDFNGCTVLQVAASRDDLSIIKLLIDRGADVNVSEDWGCSTLMWAARGWRLFHRPKCELIVERMLQQRTDLQIQRVRTFLCCLRRMAVANPRLHVCNDLRKLITIKIIEAENKQMACEEINRIEIEELKCQLLAKYINN
jgi:hypothetical protein